MPAEPRVAAKLPILAPAQLILQACDDGGGALELLGELRELLLLLSKLLLVLLQQLHRRLPVLLELGDSALHFIHRFIQNIDQFD